MSEQKITVEPDEAMHGTGGNFYFSPAELVFVAGILKKDYIKAGSWPADARSVSDDVYAKFIASPPEGKVLGTNNADMPCWVDVPPPTVEEIVARAERKKQRLVGEAERRIAPLERSVRLGMATSEEKTQLKEWEVYSVLLSRVDTSVVASHEWPDRPECSGSLTCVRRRSSRLSL